MGIPPILYGKKQNLPRRGLLRGPPQSRLPRAERSRFLSELAKRRRAAVIAGPLREKKPRRREKKQIIS